MFEGGSVRGGEKEDRDLVGEEGRESRDLLGGGRGREGAQGLSGGEKEERVVRGERRTGTC